MNYAFLPVEADNYHRISNPHRYTAGYIAGHRKVTLASKGHRKILDDLQTHSGIVSMAGYMTSLVGISS
jgi:hypothetical protein